MEKKLFVGSIGIMLLVIGILTVLHMGNSTKLDGSYTIYEEPDFQISEWMNGNYQKEMEDFISNNYAGHNFNVKVYNQFRYSAFKISDSVILGQNGYLYESPYVIEALGLQEHVKLSDEEIYNIAVKIYNIQEEALRQNKAFIFVFTPSKADFVAENIPSCYYEEDSYYTEDERNYHRLMQAFDELGVMYIDSTEILQEHELEVPVFYKTSIHWSRAAALIVMNEITDELDDRYGMRLKRIQVCGMEESPITTQGEDQDLFRLLNVFWAEKDDTYYFPVESVDENQAYDKINVFMQGGSFTNKLLDISRENRIFYECKREFYAVYLADYNRNINVATEDLNCNELNLAVNQADVILLESNVENVNELKPEMYDAIYSHLTEGMREEVVPLPFTYGVYGEENDGQSFFWASDSVLYEVKPQKDWEEIVLKLELPIDTFHSIYGGNLNERLEIYVNDRFVESFDYEQPDLEVRLNLNEYGLQEEESIILDIRAPYFFQPSSVPGKGDTRILAFKIRYIGGDKP